MLQNNFFKITTLLNMYLHKPMYLWCFPSWLGLEEEAQGQWEIS